MPVGVASWGAVRDSTLTWMEAEVSRFLFGPDRPRIGRMARLKPLAELALACDVGLTSLREAGDRGGHHLSRLLRLRDAIIVDVGAGRGLVDLGGDDARARGPVLSLLASFVEILERWGALSGWPDPRPWVTTAHPGWIDTLDIVAFGEGHGAAGGLSADAAYVLAHVVLFRTAFGRDVDAIRAPEREWLAAHAPAWQRRHVDDVDLACELALMLRCIAVADDAVEVPAIIAARQEADGAVLGRHAIAIPAEAGPDASCDWFRQRYHSTLVASMAAARSSINAGNLVRALRRR